jgi:hypothetical protein
MTEENSWGDAATTFDQLFEGVDFSNVKASVPEEYRSVVEPIQSPRALIDSFVNAQKLIGKKNENAIPGEKATPEEWKAFYKKIGAGDPADYVFDDVKLPEDKLKDLQETFANNNLTKTQAVEVVKKFSELEKVNAKAEEAKFETFKQEQLKERTLKYGENLQGATNLVDHAIGKLAGENKEFSEALKMLAGDNQYFEMFKKIGATFDGANPNGPTDRLPSGQSLTIRQQIDQLTNPKTEEGQLYIGGNHIDQEKSKQVRQKVSELYKRLASGEE